jgi:hypothetical protein
VDILEACRPTDALQLMLSEHIVGSHIVVRRSERSAVQCMTGSVEEKRCLTTASSHGRLMIATVQLLRRIQAEDRAAPPPAAPEPRPTPPAQPEPEPDAEPAAPDAPPGLMVRKFDPVEQPARSIRIPESELPSWFWRPDGTRLDEPPQLWVDNHRLPDGTVPPWDHAAVLAMTMEERRASWWYSEACRKAEEDAIRLFGPGGPYEGQGWDWGLPPDIGIGGIPRDRDPNLPGSPLKKIMTELPHEP